MKKRSPRVRLTPAWCRQQLTEVVVENFEAANQLLRGARQGAKVGPATLVRAQRQRATCYNELVRRGVSREDLDYEPEDPEVSEPVPAGAGERQAGGGIGPGARAATRDPHG